MFYVRMVGTGRWQSTKVFRFDCRLIYWSSLTHSDTSERRFIVYVCVQCGGEVVRSRARRNNTLFECRRAYRRSKIIEVAVCNIICYQTDFKVSLARWKRASVVVVVVAVAELAFTHTDSAFRTVHRFCDIFEFDLLAAFGPKRLRAFHSLAYQAIEKLLFRRMHIGCGGGDGTRTAIAVNSQ